MAWLREHAVTVRSIDPADADWADLRPLSAALAGARVVMLGEATHGDGNTFLAKARLVRYLHLELGFDVLAFESGLYDCWKAWQLVGGGEEPDAALRGAVFRIWTESEQVQPLIAGFAAAARSPRPLELAGIDPQFTGELSRRFLRDDLARVATASGLSGESFAARIAAPLANLIEGRYEAGELPVPGAREDLRAALAELEERLRRGHAFRGLAGIEVPSPVHARLYRTLQPAGALAHRALGDELYVVGVLAYQGRFGQVWDRTPEELLRPTDGSLEDLFHRTGLPYAFLDLRRSRPPLWLRGPTIARPIGYMEMRAKWGEVFDGLLFLDRQDHSRRRAVAAPPPP